MSPTNKPFTPLLPSKPQRPRSAFFGPAGLTTLLRDSLPLTTWLLLGAAAQILIFLLFGRLAFLPTFAILLYRSLRAYAMSVGWLHNTYMDNVLLKKFSAQFPDEIGEFGSKPSSQDIVVLLIGTRVNHPLGILAPGVKELGMYFPRMAKDLDAHAEEFGYLGMTSWVNAAAKESGSELMEVAYFRTTEGLHAFAHSKYHRDAWDWWNRSHTQHPYLSIYHEVYHAPAGHWENIYINSHISHFASTTHRITDEMTGSEMWASPVVDASKGLLRTSAGRMARSQGADEHENAGMSNTYAQ